MNKYELTVMVHPDLEMSPTVATDKVEKLITDNGGVITKDTSDGKKHLSYPIAKQEFAIYYYYDVELPADAPAKISSVLNITDEVIRYLLVKEDPRKAKYAALRKAHHLDDEDEDAEEAGETDESEAGDMAEAEAPAEDTAETEDAAENNTNEEEE